MEYSVGLILIALLQYIVFSAQVGMARGKYQVPAPKTTGHEVWERYYRVQQNTLEQLIVFIPGMLAFAVYVHEFWVVVPGIAFILGRQLYAYAYVNKPESRGVGMTIGFLGNITLICGSLGGIVLQAINT